MDELDFKNFLNERLREKNISLQKLSELTNIAVAHLENLSEGKYGELPSVPYLHGYIEKIALVLNFDPEKWWEELKRERGVKIAGATDALPKNRYARVFPIKIFAAILAGIMVVVFLAFRLPQIFGVPQITLTNPTSAVTVLSVSEFTFEGKIENSDSLAINGENIPLNSDGTWLKTVTLQPGENSFEIVAKKLLGRETSLTRQILYEAPPGVLPPSVTKGPSTSTSSPSSTIPSSSLGTP